MSLTGSPDIDAFFTSQKRAASALKHAVLRHYLTVFVARTGHTARDNLVVVVDGYAGTGRYENGHPGSPALIAAVSLNKSASNRRILALLVEANQTHLVKLNDVMKDEPAASTFKYQTYGGTIHEHMPALLDRANGQPLLMFLDPYGLGPSADELRAIFTNRSAPIPDRKRPPATEVLLRFDARFIRLIQGHLVGFLRGEPHAGSAGLIRRMDSVAGGPWWREGAHLPNRDFRDWFIDSYLNHVGAAIGGQALQVPVTETVGGDVKYYLVFITLRSEGFVSFLDSTSGAMQEWRRLLRDRPEDVFEEEDIVRWGITDEDMVEKFKEDEERQKIEWISTLEHNVLTILRRRDEFVVCKEYNNIFGDLLGYARTTHLRAALKALCYRELITTDTSGDLWMKKVVRAPESAQPKLAF